MEVKEGSLELGSEQMVRCLGWGGQVGGRENARACSLEGEHGAPHTWKTAEHAIEIVTWGLS